MTIRLNPTCCGAQFSLSRGKNYLPLEGKEIQGSLKIQPQLFPEKLPVKRCHGSEGEDDPLVLRSLSKPLAGQFAGATRAIFEFTSYRRCVITEFR